MKQIAAILLALLMLTSSAFAQPNRASITLTDAALYEGETRIMDLTNIGLTVDTLMNDKGLMAAFALTAGRFQYDVSAVIEGGQFTLQASFLDDAYRLASDLPPITGDMLDRIDDPVALANAFLSQLDVDFDYSLSQTDDAPDARSTYELVFEDGHATLTDFRVGDERHVTLSYGVDGGSIGTVQGELSYEGRVVQDDEHGYRESGLVTWSDGAYTLTLNAAFESSTAPDDALGAPVGKRVVDMDDMTEADLAEMQQQLIRAAMRIAGSLLQAAPDLSEIITSMMAQTGGLS